MKNVSETDDRRCGWDEAALFDFIDSALSPERARSFEDHLHECRACRADLQAYLKLENSLGQLPALEPRAHFDDEILAAVLGAAGVVAASAAEPSARGRAGWFSARSPVRVAAGVMVAALAVVALALGGLELAGAGGWRGLVAQAVSGIVRGGLDLLNGGVGRLLTAIRISDVFLNLAGIIDTLCRSVAATVHAAGAEFWLVSTLLSLLALMGAVRLATGSAVERGIGRVHFVL